MQLCNFGAFREQSKKKSKLNKEGFPDCTGGSYPDLKILQIQRYEVVSLNIFISFDSHKFRFIAALII